MIKSSVDVILNRDVAENYVSSDKASKVVRSETDYLILLKSWLNREPAKNENMILFLDVDQELGLPDGTTKNL